MGKDGAVTGGACHVLIEDLEEFAGRNGRRIDRRALVVAAAGGLVLGFAGPIAVAAQSSTPEAEAEGDPVAEGIAKEVGS